MILKPYRNDDLLREYHYALGERYIEVNNIKLCYQERGQGSNVLILPGLCTSIDFWQLNILELANEFHVIAVDPPGMGKSDKPDVAYELTWICDCLVAFMDAKALGRVSVIGGSMGGHLGLLLALAYPERVDKLILMGSSGSWPPAGIILAPSLRLFWNDALIADHLRRSWPDIYNKIFLRQTEVTQRIFNYQMAIIADASQYAAEGRAASRSMKSICLSSCRERLAEISNPTLLIWGQHDQFHLLNEARCFRKGLPNSRLVVVADAAHEVMVDQAEVFNDLVSTFLKGGTEAIEDCALYAGKEKP